jgi:hypothetical protein
MSENGENRQDYYVWGCIVVGCVMLIASFLPAPAEVAVAGWPARPQDPPASGSELSGRTVELLIVGPRQAVPLIAVVQWQDELGEWHDIDGWQSEIEGSRITWHRAAKDLRTGPFRWVVYGDSVILGTSESFSLPAASSFVIRLGGEGEP